MRRLLTLVLCLAAGSAAAATALEAARAGAADARGKVTELRTHQMSLRKEMNQLAPRIEALKAEQKGALIPGSELERSLQRSQEISGLLSQTARDLSTAEGEAEKRNLALLSELSASIDAARGRWDQANRDERKALVDGLRSLRAEREQVRAELPASAIPAPQAERSDDPTELLEQADAVRDSEDKVRQRMQQLEGRIRELHQEHDLDRRMNDFLGEEAMFDEQDSRIRLSREVDSTSGGSSIFSAPSMQNDHAGQATPASGANGLPLGPAGPNTNAPPPQNTTAFSSGEDARPTADPVINVDLSSSDVKTLEAQLKELGQAAQSLEQKAKQMEQRAHDLR
jgi:chromosome segregation ATPase